MTQSHPDWPLPQQAWSWSRAQLADWQLQQFNRQLASILPANEFYQQKLLQSSAVESGKLACLEDLSQWPLTSKSELSDSAASCGGISRHQTYEASAYSRLHRTSGTRGEPLMILDTASDWNWWSRSWQNVLQAADLTAADRVFLAFSFGPFIGFWSAHQACVDLGAMVVPGGGLSTLARLEFMRQSQATVVCCTPTYALHLAEVAQAECFPLGQLRVERLIVAGESGGSVAAVRQRISSLWQADVIDHAGATEIGPWGFGWRDRCGLHLIETSFIAELLPLDGGPPRLIHTHEAAEQTGELVLTSLGRYGAPVIRYRTGDIVTIGPSSDDRCNFAWLPEGVIGRADDMVTIRGVNIFPSSIDSLVRSQSAIGEYQVQITRQGQLDQLHIVAEAGADVCSELERLLTLKTGLRIPVSGAAAGTLPRSEAKSRRWVDQR